MNKLFIAIAAAVLTQAAVYSAVLPFNCNISVGEAVSEDNISLVIGIADSALLQPMPPFSMEFGVKDLFLVNPMNIGEGGAAVSGDMARLGTDIRAQSDPNAANGWVIKAASSMKLYFSDVTTNALYYTVTGLDSEGAPVTESGELSESLSLKANSTLVIGFEPNPAATAKEDPLNLYSFITKSDDVISGRSKTIDLNAAAGLTVNFTSADSNIAVLFNGTYYLNDGTAVNDKPECTWICQPEFSGVNVLSVSFLNYVLTVEFDASGSRAAAPAVQLQMTAAASNAAPVTTSFFETGSDDLFAAIHWIIQNFGTLDFDQNGVVDFNDATFFYNYVGLGGAMGGVSADDLMTYSDGSVDYDVREAAVAALEYFMNNEAALQLDGEDYVDCDGLFNSATFFYNYISLGGALGGVTAEDIVAYTTTGGAETAPAALEKIRELDPEAE